MYLLLLLVLAFAAWPLAPTPTWADLSGQVAAEEAEEEEEEEEGPKFEKVVKDFDHIEGLFDLYRDPEENKVYLAIEPGQFDEIFLCAISRTKGDGYFFDSGSMLFNFPFVFERVGKQVFFTPVIGATSIEGQPHPETGAVLVDASPLFVQDIDLVDFQLGERDISYGFDGDKSYFGDLKNFLDNTEVDVVLHFATDSPKTNVPTLPDVDFAWSQYSMRRIDYPIHEVVLNIQRQPLNRFYDALLLSRLQDLELRYEGEDAFTMAELFQTLRLAIWSELDAGGPINSFRHNLQREHLKKIIGVVVDMAPDAPEDARSLARVDLVALAESIDTALARFGLDANTQAHLQETLARVRAALAAGLDLQRY